LVEVKGNADESHYSLLFGL